MFSIRVQFRPPSRVQVSRKEISLPRLPPDIWLQMLRWATYEPSLLDTSPVSPGKDEPRCWNVSTFGGRPPDFMEHWATACSIVLVCKSWWDLGTPCLYEFVRVKQLTQYQALVISLIASADTTNRPALTGLAHLRPLASCVRGLSIIPVKWWNLLDHADAGFRALLDLCSNLQILQLHESISERLTPYVDYFAFLRHTRSLKACWIRWDYIHQGVQSSGSPSSLSFSCFGELEVLRLMFVSASSFPRDDMLSLPKLHAVLVTFLSASDSMIASVMNAMAGWELPSLVSFSMTVYGPGNSNMAEPFLMKHGHKLKFLEYRCRGHSSLINCSALVDLLIGYHSLKDLQPLPHLHRIRVDGLLYIPDDFQNTMTSLYEMHRPSLTRIHLLGLRQGAGGAGDESTFQDWIESWAAEGVRLDDAGSILAAVSRISKLRDVGPKQKKEGSAKSKGGALSSFRDLLRRK